MRPTILFHRAMARVREIVRRDVPVLVVSQDAVILVHRGARHAFSMTSSVFDAIKCAGHVPVAIATVMQDGATAAVKEVPEMLRPLRARALEALQSLEHAGEAERDVRQVLQASIDAIDAELEGGGARSERLERFAAASGPKLLSLTAIAMKVRLHALHEATERARATLTAEERAVTQVVVLGDHQARQRNLALQYFCKRFGERVGAEERVAYGENVTTEDGALELVGQRLVDRTLAKLFFGDPERLQRDVLGDAAARAMEGIAGDLPAWSAAGSDHEVQPLGT